MRTLLSYAPVALSETLYAPLLLQLFPGQTLFDFAAGHAKSTRLKRKKGERGAILYPIYGI